MGSLKDTAGSTRKLEKEKVLDPSVNEPRKARLFPQTQVTRSLSGPLSTYSSLKLTFLIPFIVNLLCWDTQDSPRSRRFAISGLIFLYIVYSPIALF